MAIDYVYVFPVWLTLEIDAGKADGLAELREYLESEYCIIDLELLEGSEANRKKERTFALQLQITFELSDMDEDEPTEKAMDRLKGELRSHLEANYRVSYLEILDDAPTAGLLAKEEVPEKRRCPEPKLRDLTADEKSRLRTRIEQGDSDIYVLAAEFGCSASQVAGLKAGMH